MQSPQLETKRQQNKRIAVSPQLENKGQQNKQIVQQNGKQSPQLRAKVIQRKQQNVKQSPQLESVQSETKSHQIKEMRKQGDRHYRLSGNVQNEHQPDNSKHQPQLVDSPCQDSSVATSQFMQYPQPENVKNEHRPDNNKNQPQLVDSSCQDNFVSTSQVMQYPQSEDVLKEHQPDNSQYQLQLVDTSHLDNFGDNSATSQDLQSPQSGNVQNQPYSSKSYPQMDDYKYQPQLVDMSCKDNSAATSQYLQFPQSGNIQNGHHPDNNKNQRQLEDSLRQDSSLASYLQSPQSGNVQNGHQTDNNKNQPQLVDSSCLDDYVATSEAMQYTQSEKVQNQHQLDNNKYQPQLVGTSCLDSSVATSEANYPKSDNIHNQHCLGKSYPHLDIRTSQPQQVDTSHQESSDDQTSREEIDRTINREDPQWMLVPNQQQHNKPYPQLDIRTYQPQQVNSSCKESSDDPTSGKGVVSSVSKDVMQYLQLEAVLYQQQLDTPYPQLDVETYQLQRVDTSRQESFDDLTSGKEQVSAYNKNVIQPPQLDRLQPSKPYPQLDIRLYQLQQVDNSYQESSDDATSGKELDHTLNKVKLCEVYHTLVQLKDKHVEEAEESVVLWKWFFNRLDPRPGILSTINCHMAGEYLVVKGFNVNLTRVQIAERRVTPPDSVVMVTCSLENIMPAFVRKSNLGPKFMIPGAAYHNTIEDTLHVINTTGHCDTPSDTESEFKTALLYVMKIQALEPTTSYPPGLDDQCAAVPKHIQDILKCARSELTQYFHLQGSSFIEGIVGDTCTLINYCQKAAMVTSSEGSDSETSRIWDPGGATRFVKRRD